MPCRTKLSDESQFYLSCQEDRAKDLGFFCYLVSHLTLCPEIYYENFSASQPSSLEPCAIFHSTQLLISPRVPLCIYRTPSLQALAVSTLLQIAYWTSCYPEAQIINFVDAQSWGIHPSVGRPIIERKLYRQRIPSKKSPGHLSTLESPSLAVPGWAPCTGYHWGQRCLVRIDGRVEDSWNSIRFEGNLEDTLNPFRLKPSGKCIWDTRFHSRSAILFWVSDYSTWEDPSTSQKKHFWSVSLRTGSSLKSKG